MALGYVREKYSINLKNTENAMVVKCGNITNTFYIYGGKDERSQVLIQGLTSAGVFLDEVALMPESFFSQALARCSVEGSRFWFNCNPENPSHFIYKEWILKADEKNILHLHFKMTDNPSLSQEILDRYNKMFTGVFHDRFVKGLWVRAEGICFPNFAHDPTSWLIETPPPTQPEYQYLTAGFDIGGNKSAYAITISAYDYEGNTIILYSKKTQAKDLAMEDVVKIVENAVEYVENKYNVDVEYIACDHVDVIVNEINKQTNYRAGKTYKPPLEDRPFIMSKLFAQNRIQIVTEDCKDLIDELRNLVFDDKQEKAIVKDDGSMQIDTWDSMTYSMSRFWKRLTD